METINLAADSVHYPHIREGNDIIYTYKFKPHAGAGLYELKFDAHTNQIVGVSQSASPDDTVKIGAVRLTVKELKEVKDGIQENIGLRGYIDSLLNGGYENFAANIGENEFTVNVKPPQEVDQLKIFPQQQDFASFPTLNLPNFVKIQGATITGPQGVKITKSMGRETLFKSIRTSIGHGSQASESVRHTPLSLPASKPQRNAEGSGNDNFQRQRQEDSESECSSVLPSECEDAQATPYTDVTFKANEQIAGLDGSYKTEVYFNGQKMVTSDEPTIEFTPQFQKDEGKTLEVKAYYKSTMMKTMCRWTIRASRLQRLRSLRLLIIAR